MRHTALLACVVLAALLLSGCGKRHIPTAPDTGARPQAPAQVPPGGAGPVPKGTFKPYTIAGRTYYPLSSADGYQETGLASWYGPTFHGKKTANGETYDMHAMTAAHKILPMNTYVRITRLDNGREVTLRVNDRGPFVGDRIVDLSRAGAEQLDMLGPGTARVRLEVVGVAGQQGPTLAQALEAETFYVQVGSFRVQENAERLVRQLRAAGYRQSRVQQAEISGATYWRVQAGAFQGMARATRAHAELAGRFASSFLIAD
ncbi:septal ring lytic transglycosylase RlpA family protein [Desulfocurvus vexinensis]|uniref:septal ring lytic transglycosylase RlpA family protein n=1 Tax=Desulfocurvus vexinensis TaxID=399548 RepID=UPI00048F2D0B|nr:septal ring lytic transglycosylase RlpA family protein [Desulfocurvus vexinensis]